MEIMAVNSKRVLLIGLIMALLVGLGLTTSLVYGAVPSPKLAHVGFLGLVESVLEDVDNIQNINLAELNSRHQALFSEAQVGVEKTIDLSRELSTKGLYTIQTILNRIRLGFRLALQGFGGLFESRFKIYQLETFSGIKVEEGVIVFPASLNSNADQKMMARLKSTFSDEVIVVPSESAGSGVIKPVFRGRAGETEGVRLGEDYLYLMVPVGSFP
jgi:hypothetical protein